MFNKLLAILAFCLVTQLSIAQERLTVQVLDETGKPAHPATVRLDSLSTTTTNEAGYAEMTNLKNQQYQLSVSYVGYRDLQRFH